LFQNTTRIRRIKNQINIIKDNEGKKVRGQEEINKDDFRYYKNLLTSLAENNAYEEFLQHIPKNIYNGENNEFNK